MWWVIERISHDKQGSEWSTGGDRRCSQWYWATYHTLLWRDPNGNHRVPYLNANSDGDFNFDLDNFENDWNDNNVLLCFCYSFVSSPPNKWGSFLLNLFLDIFLPSSEHSSDFIEIENKSAVLFMINLKNYHFSQWLVRRMIVFQIYHKQNRLEKWTLVGKEKGHQSVFL